MTLSAAYLRERLHYDSEAGVFTWRPKRGSGTDISRWNKRYAGREAGTFDSQGYVQIRLDGSAHLAHRLAWLYAYGVWPPCDVDHKNRRVSDNRKSNLRLASESENAANSKIRRDNTSGHKGVTWESHVGKWSARIGVRGQKKLIGLFEDKEAAAAAYLAAAEKHFGEFATSGMS